MANTDLPMTFPLLGTFPLFRPDADRLRASACQAWTSFRFSLQCRRSSRLCQRIWTPGPPSKRKSTSTPTTWRMRFYQ